MRCVCHCRACKWWARLPARWPPQHLAHAPQTHADLPGFTRSVYERNYALVGPESFVFAGNPGWTNATTAHIISPAVGANFAMLLVDMKAQARADRPPEGHER